MFHGKARYIEYKDYHGVPYQSVHYRTRKDKRHLIYGHSCNPGKVNKRNYNRQIRNGKNKLRELKNSQWKRLKQADLWKWC